jgi:DNA-binding NtrC family response regulator
MNESTQRVILLAENDSEREAYASVLRNRGLNVEATDDGTRAATILQREQITSILILSSATQTASRELLRVRALHRPAVPVYFSTPPKPSSLEAALSSSGITVLPQTPQAADLEAMVEANAQTDSAPRQTPRTGLPTIWLPKSEYSILFRSARAKFEEEFLRRVLKRYRGNVSRAARAIDMARRNVQLKIKQYNIDLAEMRDDLLD